MARRQTTDYKAAELAGRRAEFLTRWLFHLVGYSCVAARKKTPFGELDLIMRRRAYCPAVKTYSCGNFMDVHLASGF